ncbi:MAG: AAA family ATPase [Candidatus Aenigmatarchaeota archaeon]
MLILVCGLPGTGKSFVAKEIAKNLPKTALLRTDVVRKNLLKKPNYTEEEKKLIYDSLLSEAGKFLSINKNCVLDATFYKRGYREAAKRLASENGTQLLLIECVCPESLVLKRLKKRKGDASEADVAVYKKVKEYYEKITERHITINTGKGKAEVRREIKNLSRTYNLFAYSNASEK